MLEQHKQRYIGENIQFIFTDHAGEVKESDHAIFTLEKGAHITEAHLFFECISSVIQAPEKEFLFNCVHLAIGEREYVVDTKMIKEETGILIVIFDLTEHYNEYQMVAQARNESIIRSELVAIKNKELEEREKFKDRFIQNFSHELRNPLTSILAMNNVLANTPLNPEQKQILDFLKESNNNLRLMLEDVLSLSMMSAGKLDLQNKLFGLARLFDLLRFTYEAKAKLKGISFTMELDGRMPSYVEGDRLRLYQVLTNLLDNAIKVTAQGKVQLKVSLNQKWANKVNLRFEVSDTGPGIAQENLTLIFDSFSRVENSTKIQGRGLGLTIVRGLLELMGSEIKVQSSEGKGSTFYFDISLKYPLRAVQEEKAQKKLKKGATTKKYAKKKGKYKLLLVEDDEVVQMALFKSLIDTQRFYIDLAEDGAEVLEMVINNEYDVVVLDTILPNISGDHITRLIRELPFKKVNKIPIIGITAHLFDNNVGKCRAAGMNDILIKPFEITTLLDTIDRHLR